MRRPNTILPPPLSPRPSKARTCRTNGVSPRVTQRDELAIQARYADLLVVGQADPEGEYLTPPDLPESLAISTGRPTLVIPLIGVRSKPGKSVMLCWNASRESARAAAEALPFLVAADKVVVLIVDAKQSVAGHGAEPGADVASWLVRHGVKVTVQRDVAADADVGSVILSRAADHAYRPHRHGRLRPFAPEGSDSGRCQPRLALENDRASPDGPLTRRKGTPTTPSWDKPTHATQLPGGRPIHQIGPAHGRSPFSTHVLPEIPFLIV